MRRRIVIGAAVIHVHVHVRAHPAAGIRHGPCALVEIDGDARGLRGGQVQHVALEPALEAMHDLDRDGAGRNIDPGIAAGVEIMRLVGALAPVEAVIGVDPGILRCMKQAGRIGHADARRSRIAAGIVQVEMHTRHRHKVLARRRPEGVRRPAGHGDQGNFRIAGAIGDEGDAAAVRRPARAGLIPGIISQRQRIAAAGRHQPQVVPRAPLVGAVHQPRAVGR